METNGNIINELYHGDCLEVLKQIPNESIDLIYLDPPFFSNRNYEVIWGDDGEIRSFKDRWAGGMEHYIEWLKVRVQEMHRVLKSTGSIYLHCDWHADAYIRVQILDVIFGYSNFRGAITWKRHNAHNDAKKKVSVLSDTIFYYSKSEKTTFHGYWGALSQKYIKDFYKHQDEKGIYQLGDLAKPDSKGYYYEYKGYACPPNNGWRCPIETMQKWDEEGLIYFPENKTQRLRFKRYLKEDAQQILGDFWTDIPSLDELSDGQLVNELFSTLIGNMWHDIGNVQGSSKERIGYPTQKPEALLERIINASSNEGDIILDPFNGGGTTVAVAQRLNRNFIGIDASPIAISVTEARLENNKTLYTLPFVVKTQKYDYNMVRNSNAFEFEKFIVEKFEGTPNTTQVGDKGIDGIKNKKPIQVKRSDAIGRNVIDNFLSACKRFDKNSYDNSISKKESIGYIIAFSFGKGAIEEVARLKNQENINIELVKVEDIIPLSTNPKVEIQIIDTIKQDKTWEITFEVKSNQSIIETQWDFDYQEDKGFQADSIFNKITSITHHFKKENKYKIACRVTNEDGIHGFEVISISMNGQVTVC